MVRAGYIIDEEDGIMQWAHNLPRFCVKGMEASIGSIGYLSFHAIAIFSLNHPKFGIFYSYSVC